MQMENSVGDESKSDRGPYSIDIVTYNILSLIGVEHCITLAYSRE